MPIFVFLSGIHGIQTLISLVSLFDIPSISALYVSLPLLIYPTYPYSDIPGIISSCILIIPYSDIPDIPTLMCWYPHSDVLVFRL